MILNSPKMTNLTFCVLIEELYFLSMSTEELHAAVQLAQKELAARATSSSLPEIQISIIHNFNFSNFDFRVSIQYLFASRRGRWSG